MSHKSIHTSILVNSQEYLPNQTKSAWRNWILAHWQSMGLALNNNYVIGNFKLMAGIYNQPVFINLLTLYAIAKLHYSVFKKSYFLSWELAFIWYSFGFLFVNFICPNGKKRTQIGLDLRKSWFINSCLFNSEVWGRVCETNLKDLNIIDHKIFQVNTGALSKKTKWSYWHQERHWISYQGAWKIHP